VGWVDVTRQDIADLVEEANDANEDREAYVRAQLFAQFPELETATVRRAGHSYSALDYMLADLETYG
jgi:hypothetical protein